MIGKRAIAFDIGNKRIGVAISDPFNEYAMPCETFVRTKNLDADVCALVKLANERGVGVIVCGIPVNFDGSDSVQTVRTREFVEALKACTELPVALEDERFTTMQARETQIMGGVKLNERKKTIDSIAASYILESYLSRMKNKKQSEEKTMDEKEFYDDEEERIIELEDEDGNVDKYLHVGTIEYRGEWYCFFQKAEPESEEEEDEVIMFRLEGEGEEQKLCTLDDEQLMDEVFAEFCHQYEDFEDSDEAMQLE